jgi:hypothetical protein
MGQNTGAQPGQPRQSRTGTPRPEAMPMYRIAYDEGKRLVDTQLAELNGMRDRSVQFLAFVGSATAFLVGTSLGRVGEGTDIAYKTALTVSLAIAASVASLAAIYLVITILLALSKYLNFKPMEWEFSA